MQSRTEAYLGTARRRTSVRRHARLLDYPMHDGANARVWVALEIAPGSSADGGILPGPDADPTIGRAGTTLLTQIAAPRGSLTLTAQEFNQALDSGALVFETLHDVRLHASRNEIYFHTWGDDRCCLPKGTTRATLLRQGHDAADRGRRTETGRCADLRGSPRA